MSSQASPDVLILGGGLAGSAAAIALARAGRSVTLIERESQPQHKVCGEFLSTEALSYLDALGVDPVALGAVDICSVRFGSATAPLPFPAMSLTRKRLDEALLQQAAARGVTVVRGLAARAVDTCREGWRAQVSDGSQFAAGAVFLATGKHDLRGRPRLDCGNAAGAQSDLTGFKMYFRLAPAQHAALRGHVELSTYRGGYGGLQPVEDDAANLCCLIDRKWLRKLRGGWDNLLAHMQHGSPLLAQRLRKAEPMLARPLAISSIPYGFVREATEPGLWCLGDQAAVIPSFTGDGMSIALHSGCLAAKMYLRGETADAFQQTLHRGLGAQVRFATRISRGLVQPLPRAVMQAAARLWPGALPYIAERTRISSPPPL